MARIGRFGNWIPAEAGKTSAGGACVKILFDTNVIIDLWDDTEDFEHSYQAVDIALHRGFDACITTSMAPSIAYLLTARKIMSKRKAHDAFGKVMELFEMLDVASVDCRCAHEDGKGDFEDDLIAWVAYRHGVDFIVTRNKRDFSRSPVPALTPGEFVGIYQPATSNTK